MNTLPHTPTDITGLVAAAASRLPTRASANLAAAHWAVETAGGASLYGWNAGNLTCGAAPQAACGLNPLVTSPGLQFAWFGSLFAAADAYIAFLKAHGGYNALAAADLGAFSNALSAMGYAGAGMPASTYASQISGWLPKAQAVVVPPSTSTSTFDAVALAVGVGALGLFVGTWAAEGFKRPKILSYYRSRA